MYSSRNGFGFSIRFVRIRLVGPEPARRVAVVVRGGALVYKSDKVYKARGIGGRGLKYVGMSVGGGR